jgi:phosphatidylinositol alpha-1,6-mannosyltransferase
MRGSSVLLFSFDYPPGSGGIGRLCAQLARELHRLVPVQVLSRKQVNTDPGAWVPEAFTVRVSSGRPWREIIAFWKLLWGFRECQVILCGIWYPEGLLALASKPFRKRRVIILAHGLELLPLGSWPFQAIRATLRQFVLSYCDFIITNSRNTLRLVREAKGRAPAEALPLAVDSARFRPAPASPRQYGPLDLEGKRVLLTISRIQAYKGFETVFQALAEISERDRYLYLIAGTGPDQRELEQKAVALGIHNQVKWLGFVPEQDLPKLYSAADLFLLCTMDEARSSYVEGFGLVFLEAQACGVPVIGTRTGGIPEALVERETGWLIKPLDYLELRTLLVDLFNHPQKLREAAQRARDRVVRECRWDQYAQHVWQILQN